MGVQQPPTRRRRGQSLDDALLAAAWHELTAVGYASLTMDAVATRAHTSKAVLYRRWPSRAELVLAAVRAHAPVSRKPPDSGNLRDDLRAVIRWLSDRFRDFPEVMIGLMIELPEVDAPIAQTSTTNLSAVVERAIGRGELSTSLTPRLLRLPLDLARHEMFVSRKALTKIQIDAILDEVVIPLWKNAAR